MLRRAFSGPVVSLVAVSGLVLGCVGVGAAALGGGVGSPDAVSEMSGWEYPVRQWPEGMLTMSGNQLDVTDVVSMSGGFDVVLGGHELGEGYEVITREGVTAGVSLEGRIRVRGMLPGESGDVVVHRVDESGVAVASVAVLGTALPFRMNPYVGDVELYSQTPMEVVVALDEGGSFWDVEEFVAGVGGRVLREFSAVMRGMAVEIPFGSVADLGAVPGVVAVDSVVSLVGGAALTGEVESVAAGGRGGCDGAGGVDCVTADTSGVVVRSDVPWWLDGLDESGSTGGDGALVTTEQMRGDGVMVYQVLPGSVDTGDTELAGRVAPEWVVSGESTADARVQQACDDRATMAARMVAGTRSGYADEAIVTPVVLPCADPQQQSSLPDVLAAVDSIVANHDSEVAGVVSVSAAAMVDVFHWDTQLHPLEVEAVLAGGVSTGTDLIFNRVLSQLVAEGLYPVVSVGASSFSRVGCAADVTGELGVLRVAAVDEAGDVAVPRVGFWGNRDDCVDVWAPGVGALDDGVSGEDVGGGGVWEEPLAGAVTAGVVAGVVSSWPLATPFDVTGHLKAMATADTDIPLGVPPTGVRPEVGYFEDGIEDGGVLGHGRGLFLGKGLCDWVLRCLGLNRTSQQNNPHLDNSHIEIPLNQRSEAGTNSRVSESTVNMSRIQQGSFPQGTDLSVQEDENSRVQSGVGRQETGQPPRAHQRITPLLLEPSDETRNSRFGNRSTLGGSGSPPGILKKSGQQSQSPGKKVRFGVTPSQVGNTAGNGNQITHRDEISHHLQGWSLDRNELRVFNLGSTDLGQSQQFLNVTPYRNGGVRVPVNDSSTSQGRDQQRLAQQMLAWEISRQRNSSQTFNAGRPLWLTTGIPETHQDQDPVTVSDHRHPVQLPNGHVSQRRNATLHITPHLPPEDSPVAVGTIDRGRTFAVLEYESPRWGTAGWGTVEVISTHGEVTMFAGRVVITGIPLGVNPTVTFTIEVLGQPHVARTITLEEPFPGITSDQPMFGTGDIAARQGFYIPLLNPSMHSCWANEGRLRNGSSLRSVNVDVVVLDGYTFLHVSGLPDRNDIHEVEVYCSYQHDGMRHTSRHVVVGHTLDPADPLSGWERFANTELNGNTLGLTPVTNYQLEIHTPITSLQQHQLATRSDYETVNRIWREADEQLGHVRADIDGWMTAFVEDIMSRQPGTLERVLTSSTSGSVSRRHTSTDNLSSTTLAVSQRLHERGLPGVTELTQTLPQLDGTALRMAGIPRNARDLLIYNLQGATATITTPDYVTATQLNSPGDYRIDWDNALRELSPAINNANGFSITITASDGRTLTLRITLDDDEGNGSRRVLTPEGHIPTPEQVKVTTSNNRTTVTWAHAYPAPTAVTYRVRLFVSPTGNPKHRVPTRTVRVRGVEGILQSVTIPTPPGISVVAATVTAITKHGTSRTGRSTGR